MAKTFRNVYFFRSGNDANDMYAVKAHKGDFDPDKHVDILPVSLCYTTMGYRNGRTQIIKMVDTRNGNTYYGLEGERYDKE